MGNALVSVIIPFFNGTNDLIRAIKSVQAQTHHNFELILIDDGSTEDTRFINQILENDSRIRLFKQSRQGAGAARNTGISRAVGEYVAFLDADDTFRPEKISIQLGLMMSENSKFSHTSYLANVLNEKKSFEVRSGKFTGCVYPQIIRWCPIATPTVMFRADFLKQFEFPHGLTPGEDVVYWINCAKHTSILGIDEIYSEVTVSMQSAAYNPIKQLAGLCNIAVKVYSDQQHRENRKLVLQLLENAKIIVSKF